LATALTAFAATLAASCAMAQVPVKVVASFSILADLVRNVGGERVEVVSLVGPNGDSHVYAPTPSDAKRIAEAKIVFTNGLGFEGWMTRLIQASGSKASAVVASQGIKPLKVEEGGHGHGHAHADPHAWQSVANTKVYVANIRDGLAKIDPQGASVYAENAKTYLGKLDALDAEVRATVARIPPERRRIITTHDAFGYFAAAYGMQFISPTGVATDSQPSARDVARIIAQIRRQKVPAVFLENISDPRLMQQIARETGAKVGGALYSDALSDKDGPAATYIDMVRNNIRQFAAALTN
jgi:zinc/manganese transport system substrate-binding protein